MKKSVIGPTRFRKKPVVVEAMLFDGTMECAYKVFEWAGKASGITYQPIGQRWILFIPTLEGIMEARAGDWIIKGGKGEFYPCKPDIFRITYELTDDKTPSLE